MARPSKPLISRAAAVAASIEIIDSEGLDAFSLPRLAKHIGVRAPSLYHHFSDKSEILEAVARQIAGAGNLPRRKPGPDWPEFFVTLSMNLRRSILKHRNAAPILLQYLPRDLLIGTYEDTARFLEKSGVPAHLHVQILDGMERLTLGAVLTEAMRKPSTKSTIFPNVDPESQPLLSKALAANEMTSRQLFEEMIRSFLHGVVRNESTAITDAAPSDNVRVSAN
ncbi:MULTISPECIES: TetR family transcriptional regulator [Rhodococcus]|jgi:AcrR family transcriptional regulator|uniref:Probable tetracycline repressor protein n=1 Tax=Rhodococcus jostii (strain RHA1) TaxID=101510 RepID=Q0SJS8_RHOJR|nr:MULTISPECIES: TetR family transcriptional regulator [Rhodococcus]ABG92208.1 probable tetracycline repressor protein [Rhodococcus jostii RHA1]